MTTLVAEEAPLCDEEVTRTVETTHQTTRYLTTADTRAMQVRNDGARDSPWQQWASTGVQSPVRHCLRSNSRALGGSWVRADARLRGSFHTIVECVLSDLHMYKKMGAESLNIIHYLVEENTNHIHRFAGGGASL